MDGTVEILKRTPYRVDMHVHGPGTMPVNNFKGELET